MFSQAVTDKKIALKEKQALAKEMSGLKKELSADKDGFRMSENTLCFNTAQYHTIAST